MRRAVVENQPRTDARTDNASWEHLPWPQTRSAPDLRSLASRVNIATRIVNDIHILHGYIWQIFKQSEKPIINWKPLNRKFILDFSAVIVISQKNSRLSRLHFKISGYFPVPLVTLIDIWMTRRCFSQGFSKILDYRSLRFTKWNITPLEDKQENYPYIHSSCPSATHLYLQSILINSRSVVHLTGPFFFVIFWFKNII